MPSFDIVSKTDIQKLDNAVNVAQKELTSRFDLKDSGSTITLDKKNLQIEVVSDIDLHGNAVVDILISRSIKQGVEPKTYDLSQDFVPSGKTVIKKIKITEGIDKENGKKIVKMIKDSGLKVQASIMDDIVRVTGKKIDDLQAVIALMKNSELPIPLQYVNMKN